MVKFFLRYPCICTLVIIRYVMGTILFSTEEDKELTTMTFLR